MLKTVYALLLIGAAAGVGLAAIAGVYRYRLYKLTKEPQHRASIWVDAGVVLVQGVLGIRLITLGSVSDASIWSWSYLLGLALLTIGLARQSILLYTELADVEVENGLVKEE